MGAPAGLGRRLGEEAAVPAAVSPLRRASSVRVGIAGRWRLLWPWWVARGRGDRLGRFSSAARLPGRAATALGGWKGGAAGIRIWSPGAVRPLRSRAGGGCAASGSPPGCGGGGNRPGGSGRRRLERVPARVPARALYPPFLPRPPAWGLPRAGAQRGGGGGRKNLGGCWGGGRRPEGGR